MTKQTGKWNTRPRLFKTYSRCTPALNLTPRIHAPVLSPLIRNGLHESTTSSLAFLLRSPSISHYFILERRTFRRKMYLHDCETNFITGVIIRRIYYRRFAWKSRSEEKIVRFLARRVSVWLGLSCKYNSTRIWNEFVRM